MTGTERFCTCGEVKVGGRPTGNRNWNPDCPVHPWTEAMQARVDQSVELQRQAAAARKAVRERTR